MKVIASREPLLAAAQLASRALPKKEVLTKEALMNFLVAAEPGSFTLTACDMELGLQVRVEGVEIKEPGRALLGAEKLVAILKVLTEEDVTIRVKEGEVEAAEEGTEGTLLPSVSSSGTCKVMAGMANYSMPCANPDEYPEFPAWDDSDGHHEFPAGALATLIERSVFAAAEETARYSMTGVLWECEGDVAKLIATDGRRMALVTTHGALSLGGHSTIGRSVVVPSRAMHVLCKHLKEDPDATLKVCLRANDALFATERTLIYSRLVEGRFPDWKAVLPKQAGVILRLSVGDFARAVKQAAIMADRESSRVTLKFMGDRVTLSARGATSGRSKVDAELKTPHEGAPLTVHMNPVYLLDVLKVLPDDGEITLSMQPPEGEDKAVCTPVVLRFDEDFTSILMPLT